MVTQYSFHKGNDQAVGFNVNVLLLINVLLDNSVAIIITFSQPSIDYFLEPDYTHFSSANSHNTTILN